MLTSYSLSSIHNVAYDAKSILASIELILMHYGPMIDLKGLSCSYHNENWIIASVIRQNGAYTYHTHPELTYIPTSNKHVQFTSNLHTSG